MKKITTILLSILFSLSISKTSYAQVKNSDYENIKLLSDKFNIKIEESNKQLTRKEIALLLIEVLNKIPKKNLTEQDKFDIENLKQNYTTEIESIRVNLEALNDQVDINTSNIERIDNTINLLDDNLSLSFFGSIAFRNCFMSTDILTQPQNIFNNIKGNTFQTRISGGVTGRFVDDFNYQLRIFTGDSNSFNVAWYPSVTNLTRLPFVFDRFFIGYQPNMINNENNKFFFTAGKSNNFFPETELFFDEDVSFNGFSQQYKYSDKKGVLKEIFFGLSENALTVDGPSINSFVFGGKAGIEIEPIEKFKIKATSSYVTISGAEKTAIFQFSQGYIGETGKKNRFDSSGNKFINQFNLFDASLKMSYDIMENFPIAIFADFVNNFGAKDKNKGYLFGLSLGNFNKKGDIFFSYNYKVLEQDYNLSYFVQEQMGGTDVSGHQIDLGYQIADKTKIFITTQNRNSLSNPSIPTLNIIYTNIRQDF